MDNSEDFSPISNLVKLERLHLGNTKISDISFIIKNKNIKYIDLSYTKVVDFFPLFNLDKLEFLDASFTKITDISFFEKNINLKRIKISNCKVKKYKFKRRIMVDENKF